MAISRSKKRATVSTVPIKFKPFISDFNSIDNLAKSMGKDRPEVVRILVSEALKARRLKSVGRDETLEDVVMAQKKAMTDVLVPMLERLNRVEGQITRLEGRVADGFDHTGRRLGFIVLCIRFVVTEILLCRLLMRDYVHTAYVKFIASVGKPTKDIESNFRARVAAYKAEAGEKLDELTEQSIGDLYSLVETKPGFFGG
jgi:hypothetical protein